MNPPLPSRRRALAGGLGALAAAGTLGPFAAGCSAPAASASGAARLRFWHLFSGGDGVNLAKMLDAFGADHPDIDLEAVTLQWGAPYYTKLGMAGVGGRAPELAALHLARLPGFGPGTLLDPFDLDLLAEHGVTEKDFPPDIWRRGRVGGKQYAIPLDTHPMVLYFQTEICEKAGLLKDGKLAPIRGAEEFTEVLRRVKQATGRPALVTETLGAESVGGWRLFSTFYSQTGGKVLSADGKRLVIDDAKALRVLEWMASMTAEGLWVRRVDALGAVGVFNLGKTGFLLGGEWEVTTFKTNKVPFSMTRIPDLFGRPTAQADCHSFVLPHQDDRGGAPNEAAHTLVAWMLKHSVDWAAGGHVPAYLPVLDDPAYLKLDPQSEYRSVLEDVELDAPAWFNGSASRMWIELGDVFSGVLTGSRTPRSALAEARERIRGFLDTPNPLPGAAS
ncbi:extracellular solute-binding protein [Streptomyces armeniacus]|uniref:Extracellular solute-binding protein n=1 Tax=Streptomyces armeniacus TaxID=83291 RepID=A0A345XWI8_9ACTN|nr:extracellular solute-binding protein [Streptomyces armeniacus]AXK36004.1 extracellular solute-binding protein [Streptomyces armeniacus]